MRLKNDRLYTAHEYDEELGMYYYRGRHYDPRIGRFLQRDPIGLADDVNLYRGAPEGSDQRKSSWGPLGGCIYISVGKKEISVSLYII